MSSRPHPHLAINIWRTSMKPKFYAYQIIRRADHALLAGGECRTQISAKQEAEARIRQMKQGAPA